MISIFVLDVDEFRPIAAVAATNPAIRVTPPNQFGYYRLDTDAELRLNRKDLGFKPAVWHGILTGGLIGTITHFDNDDLVIVGKDAA
jgi:hypothetical protein